MSEYIPGLRPLDEPPGVHDIAAVPSYADGTLPFAMPKDNYFLDDIRFWSSQLTQNTLRDNSTLANLALHLQVGVSQIIGYRAHLLERHPHMLELTSLADAHIDILRWCSRSIGVLAASRLLRDSALGPLLLPHPDNPRVPAVHPYYDHQLPRTGELAIHLNDTHMAALELPTLLKDEERWYAGKDVYVRAQRPARPTKNSPLHTSVSFDPGAHTTLTPVLKHDAWMRGAAR